jgi:serine/threonine protein kinase
MAENDAVEFSEIPDYDIVECVGKGAYGRIYLAVNVIGGIRAIKVIQRNAFENQRPYDREFMGIVRCEPLSRGHPNLVSVLHIGRDRSNQFFYYVMELADDVTHGANFPQKGYVPRTLQSDLSRHGWLPVEDCVRNASQILDGLSCLHERRLIHRDIKPPNIIYVGGIAKLADVGLVSTIGEVNTFVGSETYVPPEGPGSPSGDLYAVGKMLYEMVTGLSSFQFPEVNDDFVSFPDLSVRKRLCQIAVKACEADSRKRFGNAEAFRVELEKAISERDLNASAIPAFSFLSAAIPIKRIVVVGDFSASEFSDILARLNTEFETEEIAVFRDDATAVTVSWARTIEEQISESDVVIAFLSDRVLSSETLAYELHLANSEAEMNEGKPRVIPMVSHLSVELPEEISRYYRTRRIVNLDELDLNTNLIPQVFGVRAPNVSFPTAGAAKVKLETVGGAVPLGSPFYVVRDEDEHFSQAVENKESIVLVKGAR